MSTLEHDRELLREICENAQSLVFFGGAGVSTASGIPDFRSAHGIFSQLRGRELSPEELISHSSFMQSPEEFFSFYKDKMVFEDAEPCPAHKKLAELEEAGNLKAVVTQNIDGLHQKAGSKTVYELHGSVLRNYCMDCERPYDLSVVMQAQGVPRCECGGIIRPDVVLYEEALDEDVMFNAIGAIANADVLIVGGTSLVVYPAAGLINYYRGSKLVLINYTPTAFDNKADVVIRSNIAEVFDW